MTQEAIIHRARNLLAFMDVRSAMLRLVEDGISREIAYLSVVAARCMI